jgi:hypothetical protein
MEKTMKDGDYKFFDRAVKELIKQFPKETLETIKNECKSEIENTINRIIETSLNRHDSFFLFLTASNNIYFKIIKENPEKIREIWSMNNVNIEYTRTLVQGLKNFTLKEPLDEDCINTLKNHMKTYLDIYDLDIKEFLRYICILNHQPYDKNSIERISKNDYERLFSEIVTGGQNLLLDEDFRHIRNSIAHATNRIIHNQQKIIFTDDFKGNHWEKEYSYKDFLILLLIPYVWNWAITLSKLLVNYLVINAYNQK